MKVKSLKYNFEFQQLLLGFSKLLGLLLPRYKQFGVSKKTKENFCHVLALSTQRQSNSFHVVKMTRTNGYDMRENEKRTCEACKTYFFLC